jgi:citrate synthase
MDKMILMVGGHEIYLETASINDNKAELILGYGHNMQRDGSPDARLVTTTAYTPGKEKNITCTRYKRGLPCDKFRL